MTEAPLIQQGIIHYYSGNNRSGIIQSEKQHYIFDADTILIEDTTLYKNASIYFYYQADSKKVTALSSDKNQLVSYVQQIDQDHNKLIEVESSSTEKCDKKETSLKDKIKRIQVLNKRQKLIFYSCSMYYSCIALWVCNSDRFLGLKFHICYLLIIAIIFMIIFIQDNKLTRTGLIWHSFVFTLLFFQLTLYELHKYPETLKFQSQELLSIRENFVEGIIHNEYKSVGSGKSRRSWTDTELHTAQGDIFTIYCDFIDTYDSCDRLSSLSEKPVRIGYAKNINQYTTHHVLLLSLSSTDLSIPKSAMIHTYQEQKNTIFIYLFLILLPLYLGPMLLQIDYFRNPPESSIDDSPQLAIE